MSRRSGNPWTSACANSSCIEVRESYGDVEIRATKIISGRKATILATEDEWQAFRAGIKAGKFDDILPDGGGDDAA